MTLRMLTAGESHGPALVGVIEGLPAGVPLDVEQINGDLRRRQGGYGRGARMQIETDQIEFLGGLRGSVTLGSPLSFLIRNRDHANWQEYMDPIQPPKEGREVWRPRPGHADLSGALKYGFSEMRPVIERSSARETAVRAAMGSICGQLLGHFQIEARSHVLAVGGVSLTDLGYSFDDLKDVASSPVRCLDPKTSERMQEAIDQARARGDSLGGQIEVMIRGVPVGLGSYVHWDRKLDARLAFALMGIQGIKGVEIGAGFASADKFGSEYHDLIHYTEERGFHRATNRAGGLEGGVSTGEDLVIRLAMKPIPTLLKPLVSVDFVSKEKVAAGIERSDICAVPAASVVCELVALTVVAEAFLEVYGADSLGEIKRRWKKS